MRGRYVMENAWAQVLEMLPAENQVQHSGGEEEGERKGNRGGKGEMDREKG